MAVLIERKCKCARDSRRRLERATWDDILKYGVQGVRDRGMLPPIAGGALTLVTSGTTTPVVGTNSVLDTETPASPTMYVVEVDSHNLLGNEGALIAVRKTATSPNPSATGVGYSATTGSISPNAAAAGWPLLAAEGNSSLDLSDSQGNSYTSVSAQSTGTLSRTILLPGGGLSPSWNGPTAAFSGSGDVISGSATNNIVAASIAGCSFGAVPYNLATAGGTTSSTTATTTSALTAGDLAVGVVVTGSSASPSLGAGTGTWLPIVGSLIGTGAAIYAQVATAQSYTFVISQTSGTGHNVRVWVFGMPAMSGGSVVAQAALRGGSGVQQSTPILVNTSESVEFDLFQFSGTARAFPWKIYRL